MTDQDPYAPPKVASALRQSLRHRSRLVWLVVPTFIGYIAGLGILAQYAGTSPADPFGVSRASGIGGFVGLAIGLVMHFVSARRRNRR